MTGYIVPEGSSKGGRVLIYYGPIEAGVELGADDADVVVASPVTGDSFGARAAARDLDGDGVDELVVSAPTDDSVAVDSGAVYLWNGRDLMESMEEVPETTVP